MRKALVGWMMVALLIPALAAAGQRPGGGGGTAKPGPGAGQRTPPRSSPAPRHPQVREGHQSAQQVESRARDLDSDLRRASLPRLPRHELRVRDPEPNERVRREPPRRVGGVPIDELAASDGVPLTQRPQDETEERAERVALPVDKRPRIVGETNGKRQPPITCRRDLRRRFSEEHEATIRLPPPPMEVEE